MSRNNRGEHVNDVEENSSDTADAPGLRHRKKAQRRNEILKEARALFATKGVDATTMNDIALAVGVSTPTIFNYFGGKDGILIALITEGAAEARARERAIPPRTDGDFAAIVVALFARFSRDTLSIASKRIWRYAEAAAIRHPKADLSREYAEVDRALVQAVTRFFDQYDLRMQSTQQPDCRVIAQLFFDVWNASFLSLIKDDDLGLDQHEADLRIRLSPICEILFDESFLHSPGLKPQGNRHAYS